MIGLGMASIPFEAIAGERANRKKPAFPAGSRRQDRGGDFTAEFEKVWQTVRDRFYDKNLHGVDWKRVGEAYRPRVLLAETRAEFADLMNQMLAELKASHTAYLTRDDLEFYMLPAVIGGDMRGHQVEHIGIMGRREGKAFLVAGALEGGPAEKAGIASGDRLLTADGQPFTSAGSFRGKEGKSVTIELMRPGENRIRAVTVVPVVQNLLQAFLDATRKSARVLNVDGRKIGYVHLWTMGNEAFRAALDQVVLGRLHETEGLILDLRDGYGGTPWGYGDVFFRPGVTWEQQFRGSSAMARPTGYNKPMVVLINGGTRSAKEFVTYQFKASKRAMIVGTRTAGAFLGAGSFPMSRESLLELAVVGLRVDKKRLEGDGVSPDITIEPEGTYTENDRQIAQASQILAALLRREASRGARDERGAIRAR
jgi:carboxyl-terminal processing protease